MIRGFPTVPLIYIMLLAGACADVTSARGGSFSLHMSSPSTDTWWTDGSAKKDRKYAKKNDFVSIINLRKE